MIKGKNTDMVKFLLKGIIKESIKEILEELYPEIIEKISGGVKSNHPQPSSDYITRAEAAKLLSVSLVTLDKWSYKHAYLKAYRISSRVRYKRSEVEACLTQVKTWKHAKQEGGGYG